MAVQFTWHGGEYMAKQRSVLAANLARAAIALKGDIKNALRIGNKTGRTPSGPGEPPRRRTGRLSGSIAHEVDRQSLVARVGTNVKYGKFLELGTSKMSARPFIRPSLARMQGTIARILAEHKI